VRVARLPDRYFKVSISRSATPAGGGRNPRLGEELPKAVPLGSGLYCCSRYELGPPQKRNLCSPSRWSGSLIA
jgi:hypothetical protein